MGRRLISFVVWIGVWLIPTVLLADSGVPVPAGTWTQVLTQGLPVEANGWEQLVYAPALQQSIMLSQYHQRNSEPNESLVGYNFDTNSWSVLDMGGNFHTEAIPEGGESQGFFGFNPNNNTIVYHCCTSGSNQSENINHDWWYDVLGQSGRDKHTSPKPRADDLQPGGVFDSAHNVFIMHGGASYVGTWAYDPNANSWRQLFPSGTAPDPSLILPWLAYSTQQQQIYLFGGWSTSCSCYSSNLYVYDYPTNSWTLITPNGISPPGRDAFGFAYDSTNNIFLLYGGANLNDTWVYDPVKNTWTQITSSAPAAGQTAVYAKLAYDSDHNVFVMAQVGVGCGYYGGNWQPYAIETWLFRYAGAGPNAGTQASSAAAATGGLNLYDSGWAKDPTLAVSGGSLYVGWVETSSPFDTTDDGWPHVYVSQYSGGSWMPLGGSFDSISYDIFEAHAPSLTVINGSPWISYYQSSNTGQTALVYSSSWNGSSAWNGGEVGLNGSGSPLYQGQSEILGVAGVPHVALLETDESVYPQRALAYVRTWNGTAWSIKGSALNQNTGAGDTALSISIASDWVNPAVAWSECIHTAAGSDGYDYDTNPQIYVSYWNGSQWASLGGSLNVYASDWAYDPSIVYLGGNFYVAWVERTQTGNNQLYVATWNGASWVLVGSGPLNQAPGAGWAYHPNLIADPSSNSLYLGWVEQTALGQKAQVVVLRYQNGAWTSLGGALNADAINGSAQRVSLGVLNGQPVAAWGEVNTGATRHIYVKQWSGSSWVLLPGPLVPDTMPPITPTNLSATSVSATEIDLAWTSSNDLVGVTGYFVYRNGANIATVTSTLTYQDTGLAQTAGLCYTLAAFDAAGNLSPQSTAVCTSVIPTSVTLSPTSVVGGSSTSANTITLSGPALSGAAVVMLSSSSASATLPSSVTVAAGTTVSPPFTISTTAVATSTPVTISATYSGVTAMASVTIMPPSVSAVSLSPTSVVGGSSTTANVVTLNGPAPAGGAVVTLTSNNSAASVPASVTVVAGATVSPVFTITTNLVASTIAVTISATYGSTATTNLSVTVFGLSSVTLSPLSIVGGGSTTANTVTLNAPAPVGGAVVTLTSNNAAAAVPASVTVPAGATVSPAFPITTEAVTFNITVTISAALNGTTASAALLVASAQMAAVSRVQAKGGMGTSGNSLTVAYPNNVTAGDVLIVVAETDDGGNISISDSANDAFTLIQSTSWDWGLRNLAVYYATNVASGADTVTLVSSTTGGGKQLQLVEYSGVKAVLPLDRSVASNTVNSNYLGITSPAVSTTQSGELLFAAGGPASATTITAGAGYTQVLATSTSGGTSIVSEDQFPSGAAGNYTASLSWQAGEPSAGIILAALLPAAGK